jgi:subtilisin family serine protease
MASVANKFDRELAKIHASYLDVQRLGPEQVGWIHPIVQRGKRFYVYVEFEGDLAALAAAGLGSASEQSAGEALGLIELADLERLASLPQVRSLRVGSPARPRLDKSVPDIQATKVWAVDPTTGTFAGRTGKGVIIGIIDTGIDFSHPDFIKPKSSPPQTRVLRIWDMGIKPLYPSEKGPNASLLSGGLTYGVEYKDNDINEHLKPGDVLVRERDCSGHGTHVTSIAAGNGAEKNFTYVGVAPEADIIAVKYLYPVEDHVEDTDGNVVPDEKRFKDAVMYILNVAHQIDPNRPVVINISLGYDLGPHDGLTARDLWMNQQFPLNGVGRACVAAAGNEGGWSRLHGIVTFTAAAEAQLGFRVVDARTSKSDQKRCSYHDNTTTLDAEFWYPTGPTVQLALQAPGDVFTNFVALGSSANGFFDGRKKYEIVHRTETTTAGGTVISRNVIGLVLKPDKSSHAQGLYRLKIKADGPVTVHGWCSDSYPQVLRFALDGEVPITPEAKDAMEGEINSPASAANVISVGAYAGDPRPPEEDPNLSLEPDLHQLWMHSSRGPLVSYVGAVPAEKPELSAPGARIDAAKTGGSCWWSLAHLGFKPFGYEQKEGTSMASPHVAGAVALMFEAKPTLTLAQVRTVLMGSVDAATTSTDPAVVDRIRLEFGAGRLNVKAAVQAAEIL